MAMVIRLLLIVSLVTQLVWSMECCGIVVLRPDLVAQRSMQWAPLGTCAMTDDCCAEEAPSCCDSMSACESEVFSCETTCGTSCDSETPCKEVMCSPLEHKKPSAAAIVIDFIAVVAHPLIPAALILFVAQPQTEPVPPMILKCNHTRQAWLEVWQN